MSETEHHHHESLWIRQENQRIDTLRNHLINSGHECIVIYETSPLQLFWCKRKHCEAVAKNRYDNLKKNLQKHGHTCMMEVDDDDNPIAIYWCHNHTKCENQSSSETSPSSKNGNER